MKISKNLPQFESKNALFIVGGFQESKFFKAQDGTLEEVEVFKNPHPEHSDEEGFFMVSGKGVDYASGSFYEAPKKEESQMFVRKFKEVLKKVLKRAKFDEIYIFSSQFSKIKDFLPKSDQKKVVFVLNKDFSHSHPFRFLKEIKKATSK